MDIFRVRGARHDCLFHGPVPGFEADGISLAPSSAPAPYGIADVRRGRPEQPWRLTWRLEGDARFTAWALPLDPEEVIVGDGWGERGWGHFNPPDRKVDVPYVIRRRAAAGGGELASTFVSVFETHGDRPLVARGQTAPARLAAGGPSPRDSTLEVVRDGGVDVVSLAAEDGPAAALVSFRPSSGPAT